MATRIDIYPTRVPSRIERALPHFAEALQKHSSSYSLAQDVQELDRKIAKCQGHIKYIQDSLPHKVGAKASRHTVCSKHDQIVIAQQRLGVLKEARSLFIAKIEKVSPLTLNLKDFF